MKRLFFVIISSIVLFWSCEKSGFEPVEPCIVVEGWIENGGFPVVILTKSFPISSTYHDIDDWDESLIRWAKVTISDGEQSVVLTGKIDKGYFPPYIYTTGNMRGEAGKSYSLQVEYKDFYATATTTIPTSCTDVKYKVEKSADSDTLYQVSAEFYDNPETSDQYVFFNRRGADNKQFLVSYLGCVSDETCQGLTKIPVYCGHSATDIAYYTPYFTLGDSVTLKLSQVDRSSYDFWDDYVKTLSLSNNMFLYSSQRIRYNIHGGAGYWCGYNSKVDYLVIGQPY